MDKSPVNPIPAPSWPQFDNPNFLGWSVVAAYLFAAICCGRAALKTDKSVSDQSTLWWMLAAGLIFLGINKQLNLQTLMIIIGRRAAFAGGWYQHRRFVQTSFSAAFALLGLGFLAVFAARARRFIVQHRLAFAGVVVLCFFVMLRAATINHVDESIGIDLQDDNWAWVLELCGSLIIVMSTFRASNNV